MMLVVTRFLSYASHPYLLLIARLTSNCKKKQPIVPRFVSTRAKDPCRYWELWHHPENIDAIITCFVWRDTHHLCAMEIAAALSFVQLADYKRRRRHERILQTREAPRYSRKSMHPLVKFAELDDAPTLAVRWCLGDLQY